MIKVLHAADFHLDSAFSALPAHLAAQRRAEQRNTLGEFAKACEGCDIVLLSGDLFDSAHVYRDTLDALKECFASIRAEIFIAPGNHDCLQTHSPYLTEAWSTNVHIFKKNTVTRFRLPAYNCEIYGAGYCAAEQTALLENFRVVDENVINIMLLHADMQLSSPYAPVTLKQIERSGLDYLALGHVHKCAVDTAGKTTYAYPGCLMGRGFDECGQKGVLRAEIQKGNVNVEFIPIQSRKYEILSVNVGENIVESVLQALPQDCADDCYRILLRGESEPIDIEGLQQALEHRFFSLSIRDCTVSKQSLWGSVDDDTLRGQVLRELRAKFDTAEEDAQRDIAYAAKLVLALMDGREVAP